MLQEIIISKIDSPPEYYQREVLDFSEFLLNKVNKEENSANYSRGGFASKKGDYIMADDFDKPLDDFKEYIQ